MHIHTTQASVTGSALASAQAAETSIALRRARELREAASKLKAASLEINSDFASDPETVSMISAWAGADASSQAHSTQSQSSQPESKTQTNQLQELQPIPAGRPLSYWA